MNTFVLLQNCCSFELSICQRLLKIFRGKINIPNLIFFKTIKQSHSFTRTICSAPSCAEDSVFQGQTDA